MPRGFVHEFIGGRSVHARSPRIICVGDGVGADALPYRYIRGKSGTIELHLCGSGILRRCEQCDFGDTVCRWKLSAGFGATIVHCGVDWFLCVDAECNVAGEVRSWDDYE